VPELPEVETIVRDLAPRVVGRRLLAPRLRHRDVLHRVSGPKLIGALEGSRILDLTRRAKHAVFLLDNGLRLVVQPGMTGSLLVYEAPLTREERKYAVLSALLEGGGTLVYDDVRRLGTIYLLDRSGWSAYDAKLGPEPLDPGFDASRLAAQLTGTRQAVKKALMDQRRVVGVGNIYANEALFRAKIDPSLPAHRLSRQELATLHRCVREVLSDALSANGTTFRDYRRGTGERGDFQMELAVYGREGEPCVRCGTRLAMTHAIDGRSTTFCWRCQRVRA